MAAMHADPARCRSVQLGSQAVPCGVHVAAGDVQMPLLSEKRAFHGRTLN